jgi:hypothetical protein
MEDRTIPPSSSRLLIRSCESSRLQRQLLARAYQQVCPEIRRAIHQVKGAMLTVDCARGCSGAARVAAGA